MSKVVLPGFAGRVASGHLTGDERLLVVGQPKQPEIPGIDNVRNLNGDDKTEEG